MARGAMVVMKDELVKGLYRLSGNIVTGGGGAAPRNKKKRQLRWSNMERRKMLQ